MAYDKGLAERIRLAVTDRRIVAEKKMFGGLAFMLNDYMFCGVTNDDLMARVGPNNYGAALSKPHVREMDFTGRPMKGYVFVTPEGIESDADLQYWVDLCAEFVLTLPPKKKKQRLPHTLARDATNPVNPVNTLQGAACCNVSPS